MTLVDATPRPIGSLPPVGPLAFGLWRFTDPDVATSQRLLEAALDAGMNLIDNADVYGFDWGGTGFGRVEEILGSVLAVAPHLRDRMVLATKGGITPPVPYDSSPAYLRAACEASLRRMGVEVIDLYQIHRPDMLTHPAEVAATLTALRSEGKIREVGVSNHTPAQVAALAAHLPFPIASNQPEYSAAHLAPLRDGTLDDCMRTGMALLAWSPLGGGRLATGDGVSPELLAVIDRLAEREQVDRATIAIAFVLAHPSRPVAILGTQNPDRLAGSVGALDVTLDREDVYAIIQASEGVPLP
ncbi:MAG TPA: aldo/keto reductase [Ilumatobacteraceae bacterium]|nr:aldo/keto reductase [Ilumatobacteraceae bacterium]